MSFHRIFNKARKIAHRAFIAPWSDKGRSKALIVGFVGNTGYGMISFMLNYSMAGEGFRESLIYHILRIPLMGFALAPLTFWIVSHLKSRSALVVLQLIGGLLFLVDMTSGTINALAFTLIGTPYWALYNLKYATNQSRENHGNETAFSWFLITVAYSFGLLLGGVLLEHNLLLSSTLIISFALIVATQLLYEPIRKANHVKAALGMIGINKPASRLTALASLQSIIMESCMPIWMKTIGITPIAAGINLALRPFLGMLITPIAGFLVQKGGLKSSQVGGTSIVIGWLMMATTQGFPALIAPAMTLLSMGSNFITPGELSRWYRRRSASAIIAREYLLIFGRLPAFAMAIPIIFFAPAFYPVFGLGVGVLFALGTRPTRKGLSKATPPLIVDS